MMATTYGRDKNDEYVLVNTDIITSIEIITKREFVEETNGIY